MWKNELNIQILRYGFLQSWYILFKPVPKADQADQATQKPDQSYI